MTVVSSVILRIRVISGTVSATGMVLVKLLGAFRTFELVTFTRNSAERDGHDQQGEKFHRDAS
jgi:hypothetical protein